MEDKRACKLLRILISTLKYTNNNSMFENQRCYPHPHYRAPCMKHYEGSIRPCCIYIYIYIYIYNAAPEHMSYRRRDSGGVGGEATPVNLESSLVRRVG